MPCKAVWKHKNGIIAKFGDLVEYQGRAYRIVEFRTQPPPAFGNNHPDPCDESPLAVVIEPADGSGPRVRINVDELEDIGIESFALNDASLS